MRVYGLVVLALKKAQDENCTNLNERELARVGQYGKHPGHICQDLRNGQVRTYGTR